MTQPENVSVVCLGIITQKVIPAFCYRHLPAFFDSEYPSNKRTAGMDFEELIETLSKGSRPQMVTASNEVHDERSSRFFAGNVAMTGLAFAR